jgi:hypothetical protein
MHSSKEEKSDKTALSALFSHFLNFHLSQFVHRPNIYGGHFPSSPSFPILLSSREEEGSLKQIKFNITGKEPPVEIIEIECIMADFFEAGITGMVREGESGDFRPVDVRCQISTDVSLLGEVLKVLAGEKEMVFKLDKNL